ncbi:MAG: type II secretion system protein [Sedimentisphaerales bacterium]|jgi:prepilin-type N-terminal cleavage/methylation domain-containing protein/prepilin-type processing-associated H-X9-DG protein
MKESIVEAKQDRVSKRKRNIMQQSGFTLVELLVVIAIIALLMGILLPSLNKARQTAYCAKTGGNMHNVGIAMETFTNDNGTYPPSYLYPKDATVDDVKDIVCNEDESHPFGYVHWSWFLFESGRVDASAFTCPAIKGGGCPRTNPGKKLSDWEKGQIDQTSSSGPNPSLQDKQAPRMAFTANAVVIPRNKFACDDTAKQYQRHNRLVNPTEIQRPAEVILLTEFNEDWQAIEGPEDATGGALVSKSHRPILPFTHSATGYAGYAIYNDAGTRFEYGTGYNTANVSWGLKNLADISNPVNNYIDGQSGHQLNAVGRHHPGTWKATTDKGANQDMGGTTMFLYCDGHTERKTILETVQKLEWGKKFYSVTGDQLVFY